MSGDGRYGLMEVELRSVNSSAPLNRSLAKDPDFIDHVVDTKFGKVTVATRGDRSRPALLTYHDLGLNYVSNFQAFSNFPEVGDILRQFCVYHVNAPGQEDFAESWPEEAPYPSMDELAEQISEILNHFSVVRYVGLGVGLGANVLLRHALMYPERVDSLALVNATKQAAGWIEWAYQKRNIRHLRSTNGVTQAVVDYLVWHHLGGCGSDRAAHDLVNVYASRFSNDLHAGNLARLAEQYIWRTDVGIARNGDGDDASRTLKVPVLNLVGSQGAFVEETVTLNGCLNPANTNWIKIRDCAMVLEESPGQVAEALRLFLQGQGYCLKLRGNPDR